MCPSSTQNLSITCRAVELGPGILNPKICRRAAVPNPPQRPPSFPFTPPPCFTLLQKQPSPKRPADSPEFISKSAAQTAPQRASQDEGFLFLLFTISLLIMVQVRAAPGVPGTTTPSSSDLPGSGGRAWRLLAPAFLPWEPRPPDTWLHSLPVLLVGVRLLGGFP